MIPAVSASSLGWPGRSSADEYPWLSEMAWAVPRYTKRKVNWAGATLIAPLPDNNDALDQHWDDYFEAMEITNNWRSSHSFPLNTFHVGLKRRAAAIDRGAITAQRIKRFSSIEHKLMRFNTMTLSQMQDIGGCRAILSSAANVKRLCESYREM